MITEEILAALSESAYEDATLALARLTERLGGAGAVRRLIAERQGEQPKRLEIQHVAQLLSEPEDGTGYLIRGLVPMNSLMLITGKPKFGKSLVSLDIAACVAADRPVWGIHEIDAPGPVLYLAMEDGKREVKKRLRRYFNVAEPMPGEPPVDLATTPMPPVYVCTERFNLAEDAGIELLEAEIRAISPSLIIVDTAREALGIRKWEDPAEVSDKFRPLRELARQHCSVLVVAHNRKADAENAVDEIGGSNAVTSSVDGWISARTKEDFRENDERKKLIRRRLALEVDGRGDVSGSYLVEIDFATLHARVVGEEEKQKEQERKQTDKRFDRYRGVLDAVRDAGGVATVAQITANSDLGYRNAVNLVNGAVADKFLVEKPGVKEPGAKGRPAPLYAINELLHYCTPPMGNDTNSIIQQMPPAPPASENAPEPEPFPRPAADDSGIHWDTTVMGGKPHVVARFSFLGDTQEGVGLTADAALTDLANAARVNCDLDSDQERGPKYLRAVTTAIARARNDR